MKGSGKLFLFSVLSVIVYSCGSGASKEESFYVRGNCDMCKERIEQGAKGVKGVLGAFYDVDKEVLKVVYDTTQVSRVAIEKQCADLGHSTESIHMNEKHHADLPECCQVTHNKGKH